MARRLMMPGPIRRMAQELGLGLDDLRAMPWPLRLFALTVALMLLAVVGGNIAVLAYALAVKGLNLLQ